MDNLNHLFRRLEQLNDIGASLSSERNLNALLEKILLAAKTITRADGGTLYRMLEDGKTLRFEILRTDSLGVAMGGKGTDVAREASDLVLTDDNFATIARAVREGRVVYDNIKKSLMHMLPTNGGEAGVILLAIFAGLPLPVTAGQILWVNTGNQGVEIDMPLVLAEVDQREAAARRR
jgi:GAF domain-containing protein